MDYHDEPMSRKKNYDFVLRFLHWWNGLAIVSLMITMWFKPIMKQFENGKELLYRYHILLGYALCAGIALRIIWGFFGSKMALFKNYFHFKIWFKTLKNRKFYYDNAWGHDKYASLSYLFLYFIMIIEIFTGLYLAAERYEMSFFTEYVVYSTEKTPLGRFFKDTHEVIYYISMGFVVMHIVMLIYHEVKDRYPIAQSMLSGYQYRNKNKNKP